MAVYFNDAEFNAAVDAIAALEPCPVAGRITRDQIILVLCDKLDIWPASIKPDVGRGILVLS